MHREAVKSFFFPLRFRSVLSVGGGEGGLLRPTGSHDTAFVLENVWVLITESLFGPIFLQVGELLAVNGSSALSRKTRDDNLETQWQ